MPEPTINNDDAQRLPINDTESDPMDGKSGSDAEAEDEVKPDTTTRGTKPNPADEESRGQRELESKEDLDVTTGMVPRAKYQQVVDKVGYFEQKLDLMENWMRHGLPSSNRRVDPVAEELDDWMGDWDSDSDSDFDDYMRHSRRREFEIMQGVEMLLRETGRYQRIAVLDRKRRKREARFAHEKAEPEKVEHATPSTDQHEEKQSASQLVLEGARAALNRLSWEPFKLAAQRHSLDKNSQLLKPIDVLVGEPDLVFDLSFHQTGDKKKLPTSRSM